MATLVLALNPSIDAEWNVAEVRWEEKNVVQSERRWAGGKGVNVARWLHHLGGRPRLILPLGGVTGRELARQLRREKLAAGIVRLRQATRVNVIVTPGKGRQLRFNPLGPKLNLREWRGVFRNIKTALASVDCLVLSGSLPREAPSEIYAQAIKLARRAQRRVLLDCDGAPLTAALAAEPFLVKPNEHELAQWCGRAIRSAADVLRAARQLSLVSRGWVLVSRGGQGAILVNAVKGFACQADAPKIKVANTVGVGDALLAAVARQIEKNATPSEWLRWGVATGTAAAQCRAGELAGVKVIRQLAARIVPRSV